MRLSLALTDAHGVSVSEAIEALGLDPAAMKRRRLSADAFAYLEFHIEQGPVLESEALPLGVVTADRRADRLRLKFDGAANHAGTTPMHLRHDAMAAAAEWIVAVEQIAMRQEGSGRHGGSVETRPGAGNVIAGRGRGYAGCAPCGRCDASGGARCGFCRKRSERRISVASQFAWRADDASSGGSDGCRA